MPPLISVTDCKGTYDHLRNETIGPSEDSRSAIDLAIIREDLVREWKTFRVSSLSSATEQRSLFAMHFV